MKSKISSKIKSASRLIDRFKINEAAADNETKMLFHDLVHVYNEVIQSGHDIKSLKKSLKTREKEFGKAVTNMSKQKNAAKKALKNSFKTPVAAVQRATHENGEEKNTNETAIRARVKTEV